MDPKQELLHKLQVLVQEQGRQELRPLAFQPPPVLVDDIHTKPSRGLQTGFFQGILFNVGSNIILFYRNKLIFNKFYHFPLNKEFIEARFFFS